MNKEDHSKGKMLVNLEDQVKPSLWERMIIFPNNSYKKAFDLVVGISVIMDLILSCYK